MENKAQPDIVERPAFTVAGLKYRGRNEEGEVPALWGQLGAQGQALDEAASSPHGYGVIGNFDRESGEFDYLAGMEVPSAEAAPEGLDTWEVEAQRYAVFPTTLDDLMDTMRLIYETWFPSSGYRRADGAEFEFYGEEFDPEDRASRMYLYIPVEPA